MAEFAAQPLGHDDQSFGNRVLKAVGEQARASLGSIPSFMLPYLAADTAADAECEDDGTVHVRLALPLPASPGVLRTRSASPRPDSYEAPNSPGSVDSLGEAAVAAPSAAFILTAPSLSTASVGAPSPVAPSAASSSEDTGALTSAARTPATRPPLTAFAAQLASASQGAAERLADRFVEQLQHHCLDEAQMGLATSIWELQWPSGSRTFINAAARFFASRVERIGFEQVEWWNGKEWRGSQGRFHLLHDNVYEKYYMRLRVRWLDRLPPELGDSGFGGGRRDDIDRHVPLAEQVRRTLEVQRELLEGALQAQATADAARASAAAHRELEGGRGCRRAARAATSGGPAG